MHKTFVCRAYPDARAETIMDQGVDTSRFMWNLGLEQRILAYELGQYVNYKRQCHDLPALKEAYPWLKNVPSDVLQQTLLDLHNTFQGFFGGNNNFPRYKNRYGKQTFRLQQRIKTDKKFPGQSWPAIELQRHNSKWGQVKLPKIKWLKIRLTQKIVGDIKFVTVVRSAGQWFVHICCELPDVKPKKLNPAAVVGIDMGVVTSFTTSTQKTMNTPLISKREDNQLKYFQQKMARQEKGSKRHKKVKNRFARLHRKITARRISAVHTLTHQLVEKHDVIGYEDIDIEKLVRTYFADDSQRAKDFKRLLRQQGWYAFKKQVVYKAYNSGKVAVAIDPAYTSQRCHRCKHTAKENRISRSQFVCQQCPWSGDADYNAACNIALAAGSVVFAQSFSMKQ